MPAPRAQPPGQANGAPQLFSTNLSLFFTGTRLTFGFSAAPLDEATGAASMLEVAAAAAAVAGAAVAVAVVLAVG